MEKQQSWRNNIKTTTCSRNAGRVLFCLLSNPSRKGQRESEEKVMGLQIKLLELTEEVEKKTAEFIND
ncbi:hypothetical protein F3Y22_tig00112293pilonHSYRG00055 [Hibiscus syriacus]|uniref:Uncharacterized protein n=1 Tax=Hibiscus syriacus TaxID=106335 RepID=A0A6A2Y9Q3_HIBSY|nr:hypothetical protein F3Y22_tig00112293pilonHSYRG00055 [Hibiscus syriacus]